jgi:hypothetical protein
MLTMKRILTGSTLEKRAIRKKAFKTRRRSIRSLKQSVMRSYFIYIYSSSGVISVIKSRRVRWTIHIARMGEKRKACIVLFEISEGSDTSKN